MKVYKGSGASEGIVIGKAFVYEQNKPKIYRKYIKGNSIDEEIAKFRNAIEKTESYINYTKELSKNSLDSDYSFIFDIYLLFLKDSMLVDETINHIKNNSYTAEYALNKVAKNIIASFEASNDEYLRERKHDIEHITDKLMLFMGGENIDFHNIESGSIIIAKDISPSMLVQLLHYNIAGFATDMGSRVTHTSIIARAVSMPAVVGLSDISKNVETGDTIIINAFEGLVIVNPDDVYLTKYSSIKERYNFYISELKNDSGESEVTTLDGYNINMFLNIEINEELMVNYIDLSQGIGLYRTEFIYLTKGDVSEEEQFNILKEAVDKLNGKEVVIRTFDLGGEKLTSLLPHPEEVNPALGLRAIRYSLRFKDFFKKQLRAILRAAYYGKVSIMFPMVSSIHEIKRINEILNEVRGELNHEGVKYGEVKTGIMIEIPAAAINAEMLADYVDFFSVGTNDLTQYTLGVDRNNEYVAELFDPVNPAVLYLLKNVFEVSKKKNVGVTVCGEMAGDPIYIPVLLGIGFKNLSMSPTNILKARYVVRHVKISDCESLVDNILYAYNEGKHLDLLKRFVEERYKGVFFNE
ncbi:MAG: phosphoenolpyruvate--protein phosphotransferase [Deferribacterales bacterium]